MEADEIRRILIDELNRTFVTPFDREDIFALSRSIDDVIDYADSTVSEMVVLKVKPTPYMLRIASLLRDAAYEIYQAVLRLQKHPSVAIDHAQRLLPKLRHAGAVFLGNYSPVALGDYAAGPSHVLPTAGTARWASGLSSNHFLRTSSVIQYSAEALAQIAPDVMRMADVEGLTAHRASVELRL